MDMVIKHNNITYDLTHKRITLRTERDLRKVYDGIKKFIDETTPQVIVERISRAADKVPQLWHYMTQAGNLNPKTLGEMAARLIEANEKLREEQGEAWKELTLADATEQAKKDLQADLGKFISSNPAVARLLIFNMSTWPTSLSALRKGIEVIRQTVDRTILPDDVCAAIDDENIDDGVFADVTPDEVADYVNRFCEAFR